MLQPLVEIRPLALRGGGDSAQVSKKKEKRELNTKHEGSLKGSG